jgi:hypothetical protein
VAAARRVRRADSQARDPPPGLLGGGDHGLVLVQDDRPRLGGGASGARTRGAQVSPDPGSKQRCHLGSEPDIVLAVVRACAIPVQVYQRPACTARVELDAHLVTDARGPPHLPPAQVAAQVAAGLRAERSDRPAGRQPLPTGLAARSAWLIPGLWQHPEEAAQGLVNDPVLTGDMDGQPGTGIGQQPAPPVDADRAMQDGDGLVAERNAVRCAPSEADQGRTRPVPRRIGPHDRRLRTVAVPRIPPRCGVPAAACLRSSLRP